MMRSLIIKSAKEKSGLDFIGKSKSPSAGLLGSKKACA
jgi:hypothetical protein